MDTEEDLEKVREILKKELISNNRIPVCFHQYSEISTRHFSTICELANGDLLTAWYAGREEGSGGFSDFV